MNFNPYKVSNTNLILSKGEINMSDCIFCKIANHDIPGKIIYEDDVCMAFLDLSQTTDGHTLVIPKKHYAHILEVDQQ